MDPIVNQVVEERMRMYPFWQKPLPPVATTRPAQPPIPGPEEEAVTSDIDPALQRTLAVHLRALGLPAEITTAAVDPHLRPLLNTLLGHQGAGDAMTDALERGLGMLAAGRPGPNLSEAGELGADLGVARGFGGDIAARPTGVLPERVPTGPMGLSEPWQGAAPQTEHFFGKGYISPPTMPLEHPQPLPAGPTGPLGMGRARQGTQFFNRGTEALSIPEAQAAGVPGGLPYPMFHGSKNPIMEVGPVLGKSDPRGLQGPGLYKTDDANIGETYRMKGGDAGTLYNVYATNPNAKFLDEFDPIPKGVLQRMAQRYPQESLWRDASQATHHQPSWAGVFQQVKSEPQRLALQQELQREGYDGIRHEGGRITGGDPHQVEVNWNPQRDVRMRAMKTDKWGTPVRSVVAPTIQTPIPQGPTIRPPAEPTGLLPGGEELARATGPLGDMEGQPERFHGTPDPIEAILKPSMVQAHMGANLQGPGFYSTDNYAIGEGYAGGAGPVYRVWETRPKEMKFLDAEHDLIPDHVLKALDEKFPEFAGKFGKTFSGGQTPEAFFKRFSNFRDRKVAQAFVDEMQKEGYDGVRYTGGLRTGSPPHEVKVYWNPDRDIRLRPINQTYMQARVGPSGFATGGREVVTPVPTMGSGTKLYPHPKPPEEEGY